MNTEERSVIGDVDDFNANRNRNLELAIEALNKIMKLGTTGDGNTQECMIAYEALSKIEKEVK
jgi:hypothetical protein